MFQSILLRMFTYSHGFPLFSSVIIFLFCKNAFNFLSFGIILPVMVIGYRVLSMRDRDFC